MPEENQKNGKFETWKLAVRPKTLPVAAAPVIFASALAYNEGFFRLGPALAALLGALLLQIGANLANDVYDFQKGTDTSDRLGPLRVTQAELLTPTQVKTGMWVTFALASLCGAYLISQSGWLILVIGILSIISAILYTAGPFPIGYHGLGELFVFLFFGLAAVMGTYYAQAGFISLSSLLFSVPIGLMASSVLVVNNLRDIETDKKAQKMTLAVRFGEKWARQEYILLITVSYLIVFLLGMSDLISAWVMLSWLSLPLAYQSFKMVLELRGRAMNQLLAQTGQLELIFALLLSLGLVLAKFYAI
ncbi:MAG: 1,4-dihydroxy-2-naphthoate polyprenyltransferase [Anaerolineaceae bacterium]